MISVLRPRSLRALCAWGVFATVPLSWAGAALPSLQAPTIPAVPASGAVAPMDASKTQRISDHIWMIPGYPNIPIIVGTDAVLVVDTGLGTGAGRVIAHEAEKLAPGKRLYVTTTHFHPEHAAGMGGFPRNAILLRPRIQQQELEADKGRMTARFRTHNEEALANVDYGSPQLFDREKTLDLGGIHARIFWAGPAHTYGDTLIFVPEDSVLVSGDVVQNHTTPTFLGGGIGPADWLRTLQPIATLKPRLVVPDHSRPGPGVAMIADEQKILQALIDYTDSARKEGLTEDQAVPAVMARMHKTFPDWTLNPLTADGVRRAWGAGSQGRTR